MNYYQQLASDAIDSTPIPVSGRDRQDLEDAIVDAIKQAVQEERARCVNYLRSAADLLMPRELLEADETDPAA